MDMWRYYEVTHANHELMNPSSGERLDEMGTQLRLSEGHRVLDLGCGHAELLLRWNQRFGVTGVGVDASPYHSARAKQRVADANLSASIDIVHGKGEAFESSEGFDVSVCMGASWIFGGHEGTLRALTKLTKPGGAIVAGEPYWIGEPPAEYLAAESMKREDFHDLEGCLHVALEQDLELIWMARSTPEEWDRYEMMQSAALDKFALDHPNDPDLPALRKARRKFDDSYIRWGRTHCGWALWVFRTPARIA